MRSFEESINLFNELAQDPVDLAANIHFSSEVIDEIKRCPKTYPLLMQIVKQASENPYPEAGNAGKIFKMLMLAFGAGVIIGREMEK